LYGGANVSIQINCWGDVDWGGDVQIHWSTISNYVFIFGSVVISLQSWKQETFTTFSTKVKYNFVTLVVKECIGYVSSLWIKIATKLLLSLFFVTKNLQFYCLKIPSFIVDRNILPFGIIIYIKKWTP
jgi:hypothetical protein